MVIGKRGQFFLLAAVIISAVVISLGVTSNSIVVSEEPDSFYDYTYEVMREVGAVMDYEIYTEVEGGELGDFVDLLAADISDNDPDAEFVFLYGNASEMEIVNYGEDAIEVNGEEVDGAEEGESEICDNNKCRKVKQNDKPGRKKFEDLGEGDVKVKIDDEELSFSNSRHKRVIFIIKKDVGDESYFHAR
jgi:hypothetical protein